MDISDKKLKEFFSNGLCFPVSGAWLLAERWKVADFFFFFFLSYLR